MPYGIMLLHYISHRFSSLQEGYMEVFIVWGMDGWKPSHYEAKKVL